VIVEPGEGKKTKLSKAAQEELRELARSEALRREMDAVSRSRHNPFIKAGAVDVDAYIEFVSAFNEFINHEPKPFAPMNGKNFRL
jgi:hypothetical protein